MEIELPNVQNATSSDYWSLASNQYPSGKFPKVSIGIPIPRAGSVSRGRDAATTPTLLEKNLSQGTDGRSRSPKGYNASLRLSQEAANHNGSAKEAPEAVPAKLSVSQPDDNTHEQMGTFSFGTRKEQGSQLDQLGKTAFISSQGKRQMESADKTKPNSEVLRMKLWEILGGATQTKQAVASPNPEDMEVPDQPKSRTANGPSLANKKVYTSPVPANIKTPDPLNCQTANYTKCKTSSDPIESDSDTTQVVEIRPVTRSLGRKKAPAASKQQDKSQSAKKPLSTLCSAPKQKTLDKVFAFNEKCTPKTAGLSAIDNSDSLRNLRRSKRKAKVKLNKIHFSDKTTPDDREQNAPSEHKGEKNTSFSSLSRTGKTTESCSRSPKRDRRLNVMAKVGSQKMQFSENLLAKTVNDGEDKLPSQNVSAKSKENSSSPSPHQKEENWPRKMQFSENLLAKTVNAGEDKLSFQNILAKSKGNYSSSLHQKENGNLNIPKASNRSPQANTAAGNNFNSQSSGAANQSPEPKVYPWDHDASPEINGKLGGKFASPLADRFRDLPDDFASPTFAANVNDSHQRSKMIDDDIHSPKYPKSVNRSRSSSYYSDPGSEPSDEMDKTDELPSSESPNSPEERENEKQSYLSPISPTEDEGVQISIPSFGKGHKSRKWLSDVDSPDKSPLKHQDRKSHLKEGRRGKRRVPSPIPFATSGTQETVMSDKEPEQCPDDYLTRAFDQLLVVLGRFQTKIKSETSKKSSEILVATGERIRQDLEGVEVQMQADVDKLVNAGKLKRKRLESTFEEQQEKLRVLHEKFKEEVNQQLLGCKNSICDFEAYHAELQGVADKQKASHKKLIQHTEKTVGSQLNDAETRIAEVQKRARKRMNGLKYVLKELITETAD